MRLAPWRGAISLDERSRVVVRLPFKLTVAVCSLCLASFRSRGLHLVFRADAWHGSAKAILMGTPVIATAMRRARTKDLATLKSVLEAG